MAEPAAHVAEVALLAAIDVFGDAAREHDAVDAAEVGDRIGQIERAASGGGSGRCGSRRRARRPCTSATLSSSARLGEIALVPVEASLRRVMLAGRIEPDDAAALVDDLQPAADMDGRRRDHPAILDQRELGGAAADVDVEDALVLVARDPRRARAVGREHRLHVVAGGGADEIAALLGQDAGDRLRVLAPQRLAGQDHDAGVDVVRLRFGGARRRRR